jgi:hypothetical protein
VDQALGPRVGEAAKERGIDGGEDRGVEADAHREGEHDDGGESGTAEEASEGVPEVLAQCAHGGGIRFNGRARSVGRPGKATVTRCLAPSRGPEVGQAEEDENGTVTGRSGGGEVSGTPGEDG